MFNIDLSDKVALVTGASQGLGAATARMLHAAGASVVVNYFADPAGENLARAEAVVGELGSRAIALPADVCDEAQVQALFSSAREAFGYVDIIVNNAGIVRDRTLRKMSTAEWDAVIGTNLTGVYNVCRAGVECIRDGGRIVNLASISAQLGFFGQANYAAAKAGVIGLTRVLARELGRRGITVNAVAPGVVLTEMGKTIPEDVRIEMLKNISLARFGEPEEIAGTILFLCSPLAGYITGQVIGVNGGWHVN